MKGKKNIRIIALDFVIAIGLIVIWTKSFDQNTDRHWRNKH